MTGPLWSVAQLSWNTVPLVEVDTQPFHRGHVGVEGQFRIWRGTSVESAAVAVRSIPCYLKFSTDCKLVHV